MCRAFTASSTTSLPDAPAVAEEIGGHDIADEPFDRISSHRPRPEAWMIPVPDEER